MPSGPIISWQIDGDKVETVTDFLFFGSKITLDGDCSHEIKTLAPWKENYDKPREHIKKQRHHFANKAEILMLRKSEGKRRKQKEKEAAEEEMVR